MQKAYFALPAAKRVVQKPCKLQILEICLKEASLRPSSPTIQLGGILLPLLTPVSSKAWHRQCKIGGCPSSLAIELRICSVRTLRSVATGRNPPLFSRSTAAPLAFPSRGMNRGRGSIGLKDHLPRSAHGEHSLDPMLTRSCLFRGQPCCEDLEWHCKQAAFRS